MQAIVPYIILLYIKFALLKLKKCLFTSILLDGLRLSHLFLNQPLNFMKLYKSIKRLSDCSDKQY